MGDADNKNITSFMAVRQWLLATDSSILQVVEKLLPRLETESNLDLRPYLSP